MIASGRYALVLISFAALCLGSCAEPTEAPTEPAGESEIDDGLQRIVDERFIEVFFSRYVSAWQQGLLDGAITFNVERSHPDLEFSEELWRCSGRLHIAGPMLFVDGSVTPADGWVFPGSPQVETPLDATVPRGRLYEVTVNPIEVEDGSVQVSAETETLHVSVIEDEAGSPKVYWFPIPYCT